MPISPDDYEKLRNAGFFDFEIQQFADARDPKTGRLQDLVHLETPFWQNVMTTRYNFVIKLLDEMRDRGITGPVAMARVRKEIEKLYRNPDATPFDWLKAEYENPKRIDYHSRVQARARSRIRGSGIDVRFGYKVNKTEELW